MFTEPDDVVCQDSWLLRADLGEVSECHDVKVRVWVIMLCGAVQGCPMLGCAEDTVRPTRAQDKDDAASAQELEGVALNSSFRMQRRPSALSLLLHRSACCIQAAVMYMHERRCTNQVLIKEHFKTDVYGTSKQAGWTSALSIHKSTCKLQECHQGI